MSLDQKDFLLSASNYDIPEAIEESSGLQVGDNLIRSILLTTDLSFIQSLNADSIMAVHPFEKSAQLDKVIVDFSNRPVFCDIGGGLLYERKTVEAAKKSFNAGAAAVVISKPTPAEVISNIRSEIDGPIIYTVMFDAESIPELSSAGVDIFNVATGEHTAETVSYISSLVPEMPIMASGGPHDSTIRETIRSGANAIVFNPPTATEILRSFFDEYRDQRSQ